MTRLSTKSRTTAVSGADSGAGPRYDSLLVEELLPSQHPQRYPQLRFRSVPIDEEPALGCRFLRQDRYVPVAMSSSPPSGFTSNTIQSSRESTRLVIWGSEPYSSVSILSVYSACSIVRCSRACWWCVKRTSGSSSSTLTLSEILPAQIVLPSNDVPM